MNKLYTIVGAGQLGGMISYNLIKSGHKVRIIDAGDKLNRMNKQVPWGWFRKFSLQSKVKKSLMSEIFPELDVKLDKTFGPMLLTSKNNKSIQIWQDWIKKNPETDSRVFLPQEACKTFNISDDYFENNGGVYMCDTRDFMFDFSKLNNSIWDYLESDPNCEILSNCKLESINEKNKSLNTNKGELKYDKCLISIGNQSQYIIKDNYPKINITLPYSFVENIPSRPYASIWNKDSSICYFNDGRIKLACGTQSILDLKQMNLTRCLNFANMGLNGLSNISFNVPNEVLINMAKNELKLLGYEDEINVDTIESCDIDVTPTLCPYIYMIPETNIINIHGFSGSGSMIMDKNFINLVVDSLVNGKINKNLEVFAPTKNIFRNNFVHNDKKTPLSSVV